MSIVVILFCCWMYLLFVAMMFAVRLSFECLLRVFRKFICYLLFQSCPMYGSGITLFPCILRLSNGPIRFSLFHLFLFSGYELAKGFLNWWSFSWSSIEWSLVSANIVVLFLSVSLELSVDSRSSKCPSSGYPAIRDLSFLMLPFCWWWLVFDLG